MSRRLCRAPTHTEKFRRLCPVYMREGGGAKEHHHFAGRLAGLRRGGVRGIDTRTPSGVEARNPEAEGRGKEVVGVGCCRYQSLSR